VGLHLHKLSFLCPHHLLTPTRDIPSAHHVRTFATPTTFLDVKKMEKKIEIAAIDIVFGTKKSPERCPPILL
jgi:hypothetical protein